MRIYLEENGEIRELDCPEPVVQIGRDKTCQVIIHDPRSSRHHCRVLHTPDGFFIEDLQSRNGTLLNGAKVTKSAMQPGDVIQIGKTRIHLERHPQESSDSQPAVSRTTISSTKTGVEPSRPEAPPRRPSREPETSEQDDGEDAFLERPELETITDAPSPHPAAGAGRKAVPRVEKPAAVTTGEVYLEGLAGVHAGKKIPITRLPYTLGRLADNHLRIEDGRTSGRHARIVRRDNLFYIEDLDSKNGTLINGKRIQECCPLVPGMRLHIGDSQYRVQVPPVEGVNFEPYLGGGGAPGDEEALAEESMERFNVQEFLKEADRSSQPVLALGILLVLGTILYFSIDITLKLLVKKNPDPSPDGNSILVNWSFEDETPEKGKIPAWELAKGDAGAIKISGDLHAGVKHPGFKALNLSSTANTGLARAVYFQNFSISPGQPYYLYGHVYNQNVFGAGLLVTWLRTASTPSGSREGARGPGAAEDHAGVVEVSRHYTNAVRAEGEEEDVYRKIVPPDSAHYAQVACFVLAAGGKTGSANFDQIYFGKEPPPWMEKEPEAAGDAGANAPAASPDGKAAGDGADSEAEGAKPAASFPIHLATAPGEPGKSGKRESPLLGELISEGTMTGLRRGRTIHLACLWAGMPPAADSLSLGPRLACETSPTRRGPVVRCRSQVPDLASGDWFGAETQINLGGTDLSCRYRFYPSTTNASKIADKVAIYLELSSPRTEWSALGEKGVVEVAPGSPPSAPITELVLGQGEEQLVCHFAPPLALEILPAGEDRPRPIVAGTAVLSRDASEKGGGEKVRDVDVLLTRYSREEAKAVQGLLEGAGKLYLAGKPGEAVKALDEISRRFPWRADEIQRANEMKGAWSKIAQRGLEELKDDIENILKKSPTTAVYQNLVARSKSLLERYQGTPEDASFSDTLQKLEAYWQELQKDSARKTAARLYEKGTAYYNKGKINLAEFCLREVKKTIADAETLKNIDHVLDLIRTKKEGKARLSTP